MGSSVAVDRGGSLPIIGAILAHKQMQTTERCPTELIPALRPSLAEPSAAAHAGDGAGYCGGDEGRGATEVGELTVVLRRERTSRNDGWYAQTSTEASSGNRQQADIQRRERGIATTRLWRCSRAGTA